ncbi:putative Double Clp-N motif-containing P-loop nucleoside triphosphate hydrolases superfamily protein [Hibiscus syriacus]|uniref:Double Clp-N motif-containing P-loop nucleoside triphosphate hydrolases superfamily protein n=2 Tax=Hibiscus syriacus TaxID=106335 RepID=A0A6A3CAE4_HIBSY|nr:putative Double Clp-N motif-containing P-loop nucleoside triphosphate hydrolases superfamily protein [Hibiscus syriacus]
MKGGSQKVDRVPQKFSSLLELSASNDLDGFKSAIEEGCHDIIESSLWYGKRIGSRKMGFEERTPLLIASLFGSKDVVDYIVKSGRVDVNWTYGSDGVTALHCAIAGGSFCSNEIVRILLDAGAETGSLDANGNRPIDLISPVACNLALSSKKKMLESLLKGSGCEGEVEGYNSMVRVLKDGTEKKEYANDFILPDIKSEMYGTDEFRMYNFKVMPCSRAYSHDWTECPFVHPGENARRRDPRKYLYSCVPCPEFRKGSCKQGDNCEYAHGVFESWLHPAQYRTRLCKDGTNCSRRVCFFAHNHEELRPIYASTGSAVPSPRSYSAIDSSLEMGSMSPHGLGSPSVLLPSTSTPPLPPSGSTSSPMAGVMWPNQSNIVPSLQLNGSRLKNARRVRNIDLDIEQVGQESRRRRQTQQLIDEIPGLSSTINWKNPVSTTSTFVSAEGTGESNWLGGISLDTSTHHLQSPTGVSYMTNLTSSPIRASQSFGVDPSRSTAGIVLSPRPAAFANRSPSFMELISAVPSNFSDLGSPDGKLEWGIQGEKLNKLTQASCFEFQSSSINLGDPAQSMSSSSDEPDVSWVQSLVKDMDTLSEQFSFKDEH